MQHPSRSTHHSTCRSPSTDNMSKSASNSNVDLQLPHDLVVALLASFVGVLPTGALPKFRDLEQGMRLALKIPAVEEVQEVENKFFRVSEQWRNPQLGIPNALNPNNALNHPHAQQNVWLADRRRRQMDRRYLAEVVVKVVDSDSNGGQIPFPLENGGLSNASNGVGRLENRGFDLAEDEENDIAAEVDEEMREEYEGKMKAQHESQKESHLPVENHLFIRWNTAFQGGPPIAYYEGGLETACASLPNLNRSHSDLDLERLGQGSNARVFRISEVEWEELVRNSRKNQAAARVISDMAWNSLTQMHEVMLEDMDALERNHLLSKFSQDFLGFKWPEKRGGAISNRETPQTPQTPQQRPLQNGPSLNTPAPATPSSTTEESVEETDGTEDRSLLAEFNARFGRNFDWFDFVEQLVERVSNRVAENGETENQQAGVAAGVELLNIPAFQEFFEEFLSPERMVEMARAWERSRGFGRGSGYRSLSEESERRGLMRGRGAGGRRGGVLLMGQEAADLRNSLQNNLENNNLLRVAGGQNTSEPNTSENAEIIPQSNSRRRLFPSSVYFVLIELPSSILSFVVCVLGNFVNVVVTRFSRG